MTVSRTTAMLAAGGLIFLIALFTGLTAYVTRVTERHQAADAAQVISMSVAEIYQQGRAPKPDEVEDQIRTFIRASVIHGVIGPDQKPGDLYGTPYRILYGLAGPARRVTVVSAGPDRTFDTADDISHETEWLPPEPARK